MRRDEVRIEYVSSRDGVGEHVCVEEESAGSEDVVEAFLVDVGTPERPDHLHGIRRQLDPRLLRPPPAADVLLDRVQHQLALGVVALLRQILHDELMLP